MSLGLETLKTNIISLSSVLEQFTGVGLKLNYFAYIQKWKNWAYTMEDHPAPTFVVASCNSSSRKRMQSTKDRNRREIHRANETEKWLMQQYTEATGRR